MIITSVPGAVTVVAGSEAWKSTFPTATGVPARSPVHAAARSLRPPARAPGGRSTDESFSATTCSNRGSSAAKYAGGGKPSRFDHIAL
jgi:hypothetical protein